jgi:hypothetical protein
MACKNVIMRYFFILSLVIIVSCKSSLQMSKQYVHSENFKILSIDSINNVYVIHSFKENVYFKVLSYKNAFTSDGCNKIKVGNEYKLELKSLEVPIYIDGIDFHGETIELERDSINDLYEAKNLIGLCFIKQKN